MFYINENKRQLCFMQCLWEGCDEQVEIENCKTHLSCHIGYIRDGSFDGRCKWKDKSACTYIGNSRHLLLSHLKRHYESPAYTCKHCKTKKYKWSHDVLKHERRCKRKTFEDIVELLFDGIQQG